MSEYTETMRKYREAIAPLVDMQQKLKDTVGDIGFKAVAPNLYYELSAMCEKATPQQLDAVLEAVKEVAPEKVPVELKEKKKDSQWDEKLLEIFITTLLSVLINFVLNIPKNIAENEFHEEVLRHYETVEELLKAPDQGLIEHYDRFPKNIDTGIIPIDSAESEDSECGQNTD